FGFRFNEPEIMLPDFSKYLFRSTELRKKIIKTASGVTRFNVSKKKMEKILIPLPPIEVQKEIVRILDEFTEKTTKLQELLHRETILRKKQYEYYRDKLLTFGHEVEKIQLKDLFYTKNGYTPSKSNPEFWDSKDVSWFRMEDIRENGRILNEAIQKVSFSAIKGNVFPKNSIIVSTSATIGEHALITCESLANQRFTYLILKDEYKNKFNIFFLFYYCYKLKEYCLNCLNQGNFASVDMTKFNKFEFPIISLKEQERIVKILDQFDTLCNDITRGLPAEIELRKKQYEYYRDKLLTFKEKKK
ncbi:restriction endonuclease subunit S, partial [Brachyspira pilosicoli]|uniref:restriction endonuclease subunit S n=1 Tax=Brachyspira pilosicoli TaxID=52584 RepID=UPI0012F523E1